jgi:hypothetical protein
MAEKMMVQVDLISGPSHRTAWVPQTRGLRVGACITLKDSEEPERHWQVMRVGEAAPKSSIHTDWHNNI